MNVEVAEEKDGAAKSHVKEEMRKLEKPKNDIRARANLRNEKMRRLI